MATVNRGDIRKELAGLIANALNGIVPTGHIYEYAPRVLGGKTPVVIVRSSGAGRSVSTFAKNRVARLEFDVYVFVLYALVRNNVLTQPSAGYSEADASDMLDNIEAAITAAVLQANIADWQGVDVGMSQISPVIDGGELYWRERIPVAVEVYDYA